MATLKTQRVLQLYSTIMKCVKSLLVRASFFISLAQFLKNQMQIFQKSGFSFALQLYQVWFVWFLLLYNCIKSGFVWLLLFYNCLKSQKFFSSQASQLMKQWARQLEVALRRPTSDFPVNKLPTRKGRSRRPCLKFC